MNALPGYAEHSFKEARSIISKALSSHWTRGGSLYDLYYIYYLYFNGNNSP